MLSFFKRIFSLFKRPSKQLKEELSQRKENIYFLNCLNEENNFFYRIELSIKLAREIIKNDIFIKTVEREIGEQVAKDLRSDLYSLTKIYKPKFIFSKVVAYYNGGTIYFNQRKLQNMDKISIVATLIHERSHALGYKHSSGYKGARELDSIPYKLGTLTKFFIESGHE